MPITVRELVDELSASGLLSQEQSGSCLQQFGMDIDSGDAEAFARKLIEHDRLTRFQASAALQGQCGALIIGDYHVLDIIGAGGMGRIYKGRHRILERLVAIKVMQIAQAANPSLVQRFHREAKAAAKLIHRNIVTTFDAGEIDDGLYLVMEYVDGTDVSAIIKAVGPVETDQAINITLQAAHGLAYAHSNNVIHRDIKPGNLLLSRDGTVKILDMGLARFTEDADGAPEVSLTVVGRLMGTVEYMAPEHAANAKDADHRSDIYSLGCTMYRLLTGELPYGGETSVEKVIAQREQPIPLLSASADRVPEGLQDIFARMVAKKPEDRYQSADDCLAALLEVAPGAEQCDLSPLADVVPAESTPQPDLVPTAPSAADADGLSQSSRRVTLDLDQIPVAAKVGPNRLLLAGIAAAVVIAVIGLLVFLLNPKGKGPTPGPVSTQTKPKPGTRPGPDRITASRPDAGEWISLFDGKTLKGWEWAGGKAYVEDGEIVSVSGTDLWYPAKWTQFVLECEVRGTGDEGQHSLSVCMCQTAMGRGLESCRVRMLFYDDGDMHVYGHVSGEEKRIWRSGTGKFSPDTWLALRFELTRRTLKIFRGAQLLHVLDVTDIPIRPGGVYFYSFSNRGARMRNVRVRVLPDK